MPSVIFINGSFGVGKTTVATALSRSVRRSAIFDPEWVGYVLQRLPPVLEGSGTDDFQDITAWAPASAAGIRAAGLLFEVVIVPMAFDDLTTLDRMSAPLDRAGRDVHRLCLVAPFEIVLERLARRGTDPAPGTWVHRRARACCDAHADPRFGVRIDTNDRSVAEIVGEIVALAALRP